MSDAKDYIALFAEDQRRRKLGESTIKGRSLRLATVGREVGRFGSFDGPQLERWFRERKHSDNTKRAYLDTLSEFFRWGIERGHFNLDPTAGIVRPPAKGDRRRISDDQLAMVIERSTKPVVRLWLALAAYQGLRCQDIFRLTTGDLDLVARPPRIRLEDRPDALGKSAILHPEVLSALLEMQLPGRGRLFPRDTSESVSQKIGRHFKRVGVPGSASSLLWWYRLQVQRFGRNFGRSADAAPATKDTLLDASAIETDLFEHVRVLVENEDWEKVPREAAVFVEAKLREWARPSEAQGRGSVEVFKLAPSDAKFPLGGTASERQGWKQLFAGFALAIRNDAGHKLGNRTAMKRHAIAVLGTASLLLGQIRHEYGDPPKSAGGS